ncbi:MAG: hypothetical protein ABIM02_05975 [candidate division WOR-3 bacterium]
MTLSKKDWILLLLRESPLDRIHIMKALFLIWHRSGRKLTNYFEFKPYLYGPCSFEVYSVLSNMEVERLIVQPPYPAPQWVEYYLTDKGKKEAEKVFNNTSDEIREIIKKITAEISNLNFFELLHKVYREAPDFAINSMFKEIVK